MKPCNKSSAADKPPEQQQALNSSFFVQLKGRLNQLGTQKWYYIAILVALVLQILIAGLFDCLEIPLDFLGLEESVSTSLWHEEFGTLGVITVLILLGGLLAAAAPLISKLPFRSWNLNTAAGASGVMLIVTLWMYWDFLDVIGHAGFTFFGYLLIVAALITIVLTYLVNKALSRKAQ